MKSKPAAIIHAVRAIRQAARFATWGGLVAAALGLLFPAAGWSQNLTQAIVLNPGWNSVYLEVQPADPTTGNVFSDPNIDSVWAPKVRVNTVAFIKNQNEAAFNRAGWSVYVPTNRPESINNDLYAVAVNHPYLIKVTGTNLVALNVTGRPAVRAKAFQPDDYTLRGFSVEPKNAPSFQNFFATSTAQYTAGLQNIYRLNSATGQWELVGANDPMTRGVAYWVYSVGASSYLGPRTATPALSDGLDFGLAGVEQDLNLQNPSAAAVNMVITDLGTGNRPLAYYFTDPVTQTNTWLPLPAALTNTVAAGSGKLLRLAILRTQMTNTSYGTVLGVSDGLGTLFRISVSAQTPAVASGVGPAHGGNDPNGNVPMSTPPVPVAAQAGLWVGEVTVNAVAETYQNITNTTPVAAPFNQRLLLHVTTNGAVRLLREVIEMFQGGTYATNAAGQRILTQSGSHVLLTDDSLISQYSGVAVRDGTSVGRRYSTSAFDFDPPGGTNFLTLTGRFGIGNSAGTTITLSPNTPSNPFLHRYHPDHDNLDAFFQPLAANATPEVYTITRQISLNFTPTDPTRAVVADYGYNQIGGTYRETITGIHRNPLVTSGIFHLQRIVNVPVLNVNQ